MNGLSKNDSSMARCTVRGATRADVGFISDCNIAMARETENRHLDRATLERGVTAVFEHPERGFYLVAERAVDTVGCLLVTYEWSDWRDGMWWWLQSVYVAPNARRSGVFTALNECVIARASDFPEVLGVRLYVEENNTVAREVYARLGLAITPYRLCEKASAKRGDERNGLSDP